MFQDIETCDIIEPKQNDGQQTKKTNIWKKQLCFCWLRERTIYNRRQAIRQRLGINVTKEELDSWIRSQH